MVGHALKAADELSKQGIEAEVIDLRTLRPLDTDAILESVRKTNRIVTVEEGWGQSGVGAEICARVALDAFDYLDAPPTRVHQVDAPLAYAANLEALALPSIEKIVDAVKGVTYR
jgi:pyruvate dehydrogenase E1 component beta subunit